MKTLKIFDIFPIHKKFQSLSCSILVTSFIKKAKNELISTKKCRKQQFLNKKFWLPQIRAAKFIVLGSRIVSFGQQLRYFFGQLNYLLWTANLFY
jgi:hypothetical protein